MREDDLAAMLHPWTCGVNRHIEATGYEPRCHRAAAAIAPRLTPPSIDDLVDVIAPVLVADGMGPWAADVLAEKVAHRLAPRLTPDREALRPVVAGFAREMERQLRENDHKGGWEGCDLDWLLSRMEDETTELVQAINRARPRAEVWAEAADVANFALMVADNYGPGLAASQPVPTDTRKPLTKHDVESLRATAREQMTTAGALQSASFFEGQVYAYDEVLSRLAASPDAPRVAGPCDFSPYYCRAHASERHSVIDDRCEAAILSDIGDTAVPPTSTEDGA